jgi:hypothetical protein
LASGVGIDLNDPKLRQANILWRAGELFDSYEEVKRVVMEVGRAKEEPKKRTAQESIADMEKAGKELPKPGISAGGSKRDKDIIADYSNDPRNPVFRERYLQYRHDKGK